MRLKEWPIVHARTGYEEYTERKSCHSTAVSLVRFANPCARCVFVREVAFVKVLPLGHEDVLVDRALSVL